MPIEFSCPGCRQTLRVPDSASGKQAKCPQCSQLVTVPSPAAPQQPQSPLGSPPAGSVDLGKPNDDPLGDILPTSPQPSPYGVPPGSDNPYASSSTPSGFAPSPGGSGPIVNTPVDISDPINHAWNCYQRDFLTLFLAGLVAAFVPAIPIIPAVIVFFATMVGGEPNIPILLVVGIPCVLVSIVLSLILMLGQMDLSLASARNQRIEVGMVFYRGGNGISVAVAWFVFNLAVALLMIFFCAGFVLLLLYWPVAFIMVDKKVGFGEALSLARTVTQNNVGTTFLLGIIAVALSFGASAVCQLLMYLVTPFLVVLMATTYLMMSGQVRPGRGY